MVDEQDSWAGLGSNGGSASHPVCVTLTTSLSSTISRAAVMTRMSQDCGKRSVQCTPVKTPAPVQPSGDAASLPRTQFTL